ncbi:MAG: CinA family protein [Clostridia bacterium]|nr:CinA family protein [Clostridia bacterium]
MIIKCISEDASLENQLIEMGYEVKREANDYRIIGDENALNMVEDRGIVYSKDGEELSTVVVELLKKRGNTLAVSESLTGGMLSAEIVNVSGSSAVFVEGIVSYSNEAKMNRLGVKEATLDTLGAVSAEVAYQMANGLLKGADYSLSTTGIAGPTGDGVCNEIGRTYIGFGSKNEIRVKTFVFAGDRKEVRKRAVNQALATLYENIK